MKVDRDRWKEGVYNINCKGGERIERRVGMVVKKSWEKVTTMQDTHSTEVAQLYSHSHLYSYLHYNRTDWRAHTMERWCRRLGASVYHASGRLSPGLFLPFLSRGLFYWYLPNPYWMNEWMNQSMNQWIAFLLCKNVMSRTNSDQIL